MDLKEKRNLTINSKAPKSQARGLTLQSLIDAVIRDLAKKSQLEGKKYIYNASQVAKLVPTTRKTLAKYDEFINQILEELNSLRRLANGDATLEHMREQINYLKDKIAERDKLLNSMRSLHVELFNRFYNNSIEAEILMRPLLEKESQEIGECLLCGTKVDNTNDFKRKSNVTSILKKSKDE